MVVFVDFDEEALTEDTVGLHLVGRDGSPLNRYNETAYLARFSKRGSAATARFLDTTKRRLEDREIASKSIVKDSGDSVVLPPESQRNGFAAALGCYPVVKSLTQWLDLNTLFALSLVCRQFRANLLQFRSQLVRQTLRCEAEDLPLLSEILNVSEIGHSLEQRLSWTTKAQDETILLAPKIGKCARDLVGECRRCGRVVCRNCIVKPPAEPMLKDRYRRVCTTCLEAPLKEHTIPPRTLSRRASGDSMSSLSRRHSGSSYGSLDHHDADPPEEDEYEAFTASAFARDPCTCATGGVWLCQPCGQGLRAADVTYKRVWTWRSRYSTHIGGLGTGMGEGNQGQKCGRGEQCLAAKDLEVEIDCSAEEADELLRQQSHSSDGNGDSTSFNALSQRSSYEQEPGYFRQEIEGIGGVVKKKVKKRVRVGATVTEYEDERETGKYLEREVKGTNRSWCGWCWRVVPGKDDLSMEVLDSTKPAFKASYPKQ